MQADIVARQNRLLILLLVNILIIFVAPNYYRIFTQIWGDYLLAFVVGAIVLSFSDRRYGRFLLNIARLVLYLIWEIILSSLSMVRLVLQPTPQLDPGIIAVPLDIDTDLEITVLATCIALTPGSISIDLQRNGQDRPRLYVHYLVVGDPDALRASIKSGFEHMILQISRGTE
jgi:multicomponent Na+:H+ antiporter subunit E